MSYSRGYGPSPSDMGFGPEDASIGQCSNCAAPLDEGDCIAGHAVYDDAGTLLCAWCAKGEYRCAAGCGYRVEGPKELCGECACEDDSSIW